MSEPLDAAIASLKAAFGELVRAEVAAQLAALPPGLDAAAVDAQVAAALERFAAAIRPGLLVDGPARPPDPPAS